MPPSPFPSTLSIGTDILHLPRLHRILSSNNGTSLRRFPYKILCNREVAHFNSLFPKWYAFEEKDRDPIVRWLGGRWAVKEAARKAVGAHLLSWKDVWVRKEVGGRPECVMRGKGEADGSSIWGENEGQIARCSISHDGEYVTAVVLAVGDAWVQEGKVQIPETGKEATKRNITQQVSKDNAASEVQVASRSKVRFIKTKDINLRTGDSD